MFNITFKAKKNWNSTVEPRCTSVSCMEINKSKQLFFASIIFSSISLWWIRISRARGTLQRVTSQSTCINTTEVPWRPSSLLLKISARQILLHPGLKSIYSLIISWFQPNHNIQHKIFPFLLNAMVSIPHLNYLLTWVVPLRPLELHGLLKLYSCTSIWGTSASKKDSKLAGRVWKSKRVSKTESWLFWGEAWEAFSFFSY